MLNDFHSTVLQLIEHPWLDRFQVLKCEVFQPGVVFEEL